MYKSGHAHRPRPRSCRGSGQLADAKAAKKTDKTSKKREEGQGQEEVQEVREARVHRGLEGPQVLRRQHAARLDVAAVRDDGRAGEGVRGASSTSSASRGRRRSAKATSSTRSRARHGRRWHHVHRRLRSRQPAVDGLPARARARERSRRGSTSSACARCTFGSIYRWTQGARRRQDEEHPVAPRARPRDGHRVVRRRQRPRGASSARTTRTTTSCCSASRRRSTTAACSASLLTPKNDPISHNDHFHVETKIDLAAGVQLNP